MKVVVNTRLLLKDKLEGIGWFTYEIFSRIVKNHPEVEFYFLFDRPFSEEFVFAKNVTPIVISPQARHPILFKIWFNVSVKRVLKRLNPDLFISPDGYLSLSTSVKQLAVIHDLNFEHHPESMPRVNLRYYKKYFPLFAKKAARIVTVSEASKKDISKLYHIEKDKIDVVYNAAGENYFEISENEKNQIKKELTDEQPFFVYVGSINPRKNPVRLLQAFDKFKIEYNLPHKLVFVGNKMWTYPEFDTIYNQMQNQSDVIFTGHVNQNKLNKIVSSSVALLFVSYFEGFGIPMVEAMKSRTAVVASNCSVMPEVCGEAALYVDAFDVNDICEKMHQIVTDDILRVKLIEKGDVQHQKFDWDKSAENMWKSIESTIKC